MTIRRPSLFQVWKWISFLWLVVAGGLAVHNSPGEDYAKGMFEGEAPDEWRDQHPECMDRYGFWPDGQRMGRSEFHVYWLPLTAPRGGYYPLNPPGSLEDTPEQKAHYQWLRDTQRKVFDCERLLWLPSAQAVVIRTHLKIV